MSRAPIALQMYTVRDDAARDFAGTLKAVSRIGYEGVELAGNGGLSAGALRTLLTDLNLRIAGSHVSLDQLENSLEAALDYHSELGCSHVVCPWLPESRRGSAQDYRRLGETLTRIGARVAERGMQLCYHNHAFELEQLEGKRALDILFETADPKLVQVELDTYWVEFGGASAVDYLRHFAGRVPLVHLKDMAGDGTRTFAELGQGIMDWSAVLAACREAGARWLIVEQDQCQRPPLESARISLEYLRSRVE